MLCPGRLRRDRGRGGGPLVLSALAGRRPQGNRDPLLCAPGRPGDHPGPGPWAAPSWTRPPPASWWRPCGSSSPAWAPGSPTPWTPPASPPGRPPPCSRRNCGRAYTGWGLGDGAETAARLPPCRPQTTWGQTPKAEKSPEAAPRGMLLFNRLLFPSGPFRRTVSRRRRHAPPDSLRRSWWTAACPPPRP